MEKSKILTFILILCSFILGWFIGNSFNSSVKEITLKDTIKIPYYHVALGLKIDTLKFNKIKYEKVYYTDSIFISNLSDNELLPKSIELADSLFAPLNKY